jgi:hypothetical protein
VDPEFFLGETFDGIRVDEDMVAAVTRSTGTISRSGCLSPRSSRMWVEERVNLDPLEPPRPMFGTYRLPP